MKNRVQRVKIKICGITSLEDGLMVSALGADAVGLIFAQSKRQITSSTAREIIDQLPAFVTTIGVFMNQPLETVQQITDETGIDVIQLHGTETPKYCEQLSRRIIKRFDVPVDEVPQYI